MVNKAWQFVEQHGCWWAYEGELPPPEAFTTHGRARHILGPFPTRAMAEQQLPRLAAKAGGSPPRHAGAVGDEVRALRWVYVIIAAIFGGLARSFCCGGSGDREKPHNDLR